MIGSCLFCSWTTKTAFFFLFFPVPGRWGTWVCTRLSVWVGVPNVAKNYTDRFSFWENRTSCLSNICKKPLSFLHADNLERDSTADIHILVPAAGNWFPAVNGGRLYIRASHVPQVKICPTTYIPLGALVNCIDHRSYLFLIMFT